MKRMEVYLSAENTKSVLHNQRAGILEFITHLKGPAGSTVVVQLPFEALVEASAALEAEALRARAFPVQS